MGNWFDDNTPDSASGILELPQTDPTIDPTTGAPFTSPQTPTITPPVNYSDPKVPSHTNPQADWQAFVQKHNYAGDYARTHMPQLVDEFNKEYGYTAKAGNPNASGLIDGVDFGSGFVDLIHGGDNAWQWMPETPGGGNPSGGPLDSSLLQPWTTPFQYPEFQAPTGVSEQNDPGFDARLKEGYKALERSAAAKGTLLTGGTLTGLLKYGQDYASNEYQNVYNRDANTYNTNLGKAQNEYSQAYNIFNNNQDRPYNKLMGVVNTGLSALGGATNANSQFAGNYAGGLFNNANQQGNYLTQIGNTNAAGQVASGNAWQNAFGNIGNNALMQYYMSQFGKGGNTSTALKPPAYSQPNYPFGFNTSF